MAVQPITSPGAGPAPAADLASTRSCQGLSFAGGEGEIALGRLDLDAEALEDCWEVLSEDERCRAQRLRLARERRRYIAARGRLRQLLGERLGTRAASVDLACGARGKPMLDGRQAASGWRFNVSHAEDLAVYAFTRGREVGIDVEAVAPWPGADAIAARFFSRRECCDYEALPPEQRTEGFFNCWTRKEAFCKAIGEGLRRPLGSFDVSLRPGEPARILRVDDTPGELCGWRLHAFTPAPGFVAAVVVSLNA